MTWLLILAALERKRREEMAPVYEFYCKKCNAIDEVVRSMHEASQPYDCPECGTRAVKRFTVPNVQTEGEQIPYMHPAFGRVMTDKQAKEEARRQGLIEVGNESLDSIEPPRPTRYE